MLLELTQLAQLRGGWPGLDAIVAIGSGQLVRQTRLGDPEVLSDVFDPHAGLAAPSDPDHVPAELLRIGLGAW